MTQEQQEAYDKARRKILEAVERTRTGGDPLEELRLLWRNLIALPPEIGQLTTLTKIDLSGNQLTTLPPQIGRLNALKDLFLNNNQLTELPAEIGQLTALKNLYLFRNRLTNLPPEIQQLTRLNRLDLSENQLISLPPEIRNLTALTEFYLHENPGLSLPPEILGPNRRQVHDPFSEVLSAFPKATLDYYFSTRGANGQALREVKLILVGRGEVGKSTVADMLRGEPFLAGRPRTDGISIQAWPVTLSDGEATVRTWDFGGQEIMHGTHQFFLTHRSLYIVMVDGRHDRGKQDAEYWLKLVRAFGGESPVLVVMNRQQEHAFDVDRQYLAEKYGVRLEHFFRTDCARAGDLNPVRDAIKAMAAEILGREERFPAKCWKVKELLGSMKDDYLSEEGYKNVCTHNGVTDETEQEKLLRRLADLGTVVSFPDDLKLADLTVLNPAWATEGIYRVVTNEALREVRHGHLTQKALRALLPKDRWPQQQHVDYVQALMEKFELCFPGTEGSVLVPDLLPDQTPALTDWKAEACVVLLYQYPVLPHGVLPRFLTRTHELSEGRERWRSGVVLGAEGGRAEALVKADYDANTVSVWVRGKYPQDRRRLLTIVREHFRHIHSRIKDLDPEERVAVPGHPKVLVPWQDLLQDECDGKNTIRVTVNGARKEVKITDLLDGVESPAERKKQAQKRLDPFGGKRSPYIDKYVMNEQHIHIGGNAQGNAFGEGSTVINKDSFNTMQGLHGAELATLFQSLTDALPALADELKGKDYKVIEGHVKELAAEAEKKEPDRSALSVTAKGLWEATKAVGKIAEPCMKIAGQILKFFGVPIPG